MLFDPTSRSLHDSQLRAKRHMPDLRWTNEERRQIEETKREMRLLDHTAYDALELTMGCTSEQIKRGKNIGSSR